MESGLENFGTRPFDDVTVAQLVESAGQTRRAFYELFSGREDLLRAVHDEVGFGQMTVFRNAGARRRVPPNWPSGPYVPVSPTTPRTIGEHKFNT